MKNLLRIIAAGATGADCTGLFTPGNDANTDLLVHSNTTNGSTTFTDTSSNVLTVTPVGNTNHSTTQMKFGTTSIYFDGINDNLGVSSIPSYGTGDFVVDFWMYPTSVTGTHVLLEHRDGADLNEFVLSTNGTSLVFRAAAANVITATSAVTINTWQHCSIVRSSGTTRLFIDGSQVGSNYTDSNTYAPTDTIFGEAFNNTLDYVGYLDEIRISQGTDRGWSSGFTPPTVAYCNNG